MNGADKWNEWVRKKLSEVKILHGDCIEVMRGLPDDSMDCCVTSPPYWGLRDYGVDGQMGLEKSLGEHLDKMVEVFREVRRLLKPSGTLWLNYGDCYAAAPNGRKAKDIVNDDRRFRDKPFSTIGPINRGKDIPRGSGRWGGGNNPATGILKPKDLCMIPNRLAIALQDDGWWVRSEIIWGKPNPMPESVRDRPATAHEKIFLLTKSGRYYYDADAVRQNRNSDEDANGFRGGSYTNNTPENPRNRGNKYVDKQRGHVRRHAGFNERWDHMSREEQGANGRHLKNYEDETMQVWRMSPKGFKGAHFATFPPELAERCILAGCPPGGMVFDPFGGAGTSGLVAAALGRRATLVELNPEYIEISKERIRAGLHRVESDTSDKYDAGPLFSEAAE